MNAHILDIKLKSLRAPGSPQLPQRTAYYIRCDAKVDRRVSAGSNKIHLLPLSFVFYCSTVRYRRHSLMLLLAAFIIGAVYAVYYYVPRRRFSLPLILLDFAFSARARIRSSHLTLSTSAHTKII